MAGIDNNTVLMLHGENIVDNSINPKALTNNNVTSIEGGVFGNCLSLVGNDKRLSTDIGNIGNTFTIDFRVKRLSTSTRDNPIFTIGSKTGFWVGLNASQNLNGSMYVSFKSSTVKNSIDFPVNEWVNVRFVCQEKNLSIYIQGIKVHSSTLTSDMVGGEFALGVYDIGNADPANMLIDEFIITKNILNTEDFTPPTKPFNSITINKTNQTDKNIEFNIEKLGQETINKVEVLVNGTVSETYSDNYDSINYLIDTELCVLGNNDITIRVTYDDTYTEELSLNHNVTVDELPLETPLIDTVERVKLLTKTKQNEKDMLSSMLSSKNVEVSEEDKMSDLIVKVTELQDKKPLIYGIDIDETNSNPSTCVTYTDDAIGFSPLFCGNGTLDYGSWENTFIIQGNKPCVLKDGVVQYYLNPSDYSLKENGEVSDITSGNDGDVMAEFKKCYYKLWKEGNTVKFRVSPVKVDNSWCCNAFLSEDGNATEKDYMYISTYESYSLTSKMRSLSGKAPWVSHTIGTARTQAVANGSGYQQLTLSKYTFVAMLNTLVTKSLDHQAKIGQGRSKSTNTSAINTGTMNTKGQFWGDQTGTNGMKVFHIENFYGNIWTFMDGLVVSSRVSKYKVSGQYNDSGSEYVNGYSIPTSDGYISKINCSNNNGIIPSTSGGSATTYYTDYIYQNTGTYISVVGGNWNNGSYVGSFSLGVRNASSTSYSDRGSRLSFS